MKKNIFILLILFIVAFNNINSQIYNNISIYFIQFYCYNKGVKENDFYFLEIPTQKLDSTNKYEEYLKQILSSNSYISYYNYNITQCDLLKFTFSDTSNNICNKYLEEKDPDSITVFFEKNTFTELEFKVDSTEIRILITKIYGTIFMISIDNYFNYAVSKNIYIDNNNLQTSSNEYHIKRKWLKNDYFCLILKIEKFDSLSVEEKEKFKYFLNAHDPTPIPKLTFKQDMKRRFHNLGVRISLFWHWIFGY